MRELVRDFVTRFGGQVRDEDAVLVVELPEEGIGAEVATRLGERELHLVFDPKELREQRQLVAPGSHPLRVIDQFLSERGGRAYVERPATARLVRKVLDARVKAARGHRLKIDDRDNALGYDLFVVYRLRIHSKDRDDSLETVRVQVRPQPGRPQPNLTAEPGEPPVEATEWVPRPRKQAPAEVLTPALALADRTVSHTARVLGSEKQESVRRSFQRDLSRLHAYYAEQIAEYGRRRKSDLSQLRVEELQDERTLRVREMVAATAVRVEVEPLQLLTIEIPIQTARLLVLPRGSKQGPSLPLVFDRATGTLELPPYPACEEDLDDAVIQGCGGEHVVHQDCVEHCDRCQSSLCQACGSRTCAACEKALCPRCGAMCSSCEGIVCPEHQGACALCETSACEACLRRCARCERTVCKRDRTAMAAGQAVFCTECARPCPACETPTITADLVRCGVCGRKFCAGCHPKDAASCTLCART